MKKIQFDIISPDGFSFNIEPFEATEDTFEKVAKEEMGNIKKRFEAQGYYSSNNGRIPLNELENYCQINKIN